MTIESTTSNTDTNWVRKAATIYFYPRLLPSSNPQLPDQPRLDAPADIVALGAPVYKEACKFCHGSNAVARFGGSVPDLRYADAATHVQWDAIVIGGSGRASGMPVWLNYSFVGCGCQCGH